jgi:indolepyruvate ferredoxin oxidoreductase
MTPATQHADDHHKDARYINGITAVPAPVLISGTQALVRMVLAQAEKDRRDGVRSAGFVTGYRGSPLGSVDIEMGLAASHLERAGVRFQPGVNEDLAATSLIGTQKVETDPARKFDGVFGLWYGKGPGVDRSGDALRHGNAYGSSPHGGVLVVTGDDHGCVSSSMSHQSDLALGAWGLPVIHPATVADYVSFGLWGWALSRFSGLWVGFKAVTETVESTVTMDAEATHEIARANFVAPLIDQGPDGLHWRWPDLPGPQVERRHVYKWRAAQAFAHMNPIDRVAVPVTSPVLLVAAVGKAYPDLLEVIRTSGRTLEDLAGVGVAVMKVGLVSPLSPVLADLARSAAEVLVIEEKAAVVEPLLKDYLYNLTGPRPVVVGKKDDAGEPLLPSHIELRPYDVAAAFAARLRARGVAWESRFEPAKAPIHRALPRRTPHFCPGCPHNLSTRVPEGSRAQLGIGCHALAAQIPERRTSGSVQMGGEGADWTGQAPFVDEPHVFQNLGDGTFFHSGHIAIRQAVAAGVNITFKILYNQVVAMTGGQSVDGPLDVPQITRMVAAEGVGKIVVVGGDRLNYPAEAVFAEGTTFSPRDKLDDVQRELRNERGVTVLIYDQACALETRRRRKRGIERQPSRRVFINESVCEGCGDCQKTSNCLAIVPVDTPWGRKRQVDQSSCTVDMSCLKGLCPSFVTVVGADSQQCVDDVKAASALAHAVNLPEATTGLVNGTYELVLGGIGGTGIVTVAGLIALAAHIEGLSASVLDFSGFSQKGGAVLSHVRIAKSKDSLHQSRITPGGADVLLAADLVVATGPDNLELIRPGHTRVVANTAETQVGAMLRDPSARIDAGALLRVITSKTGTALIDAFDANALATRLLGSLYTNVLLLGYLWQRGLLPLPLTSIEQAIRVASVDVERNLVAFACGRVAAADPTFFKESYSEQMGADESLVAKVRRHAMALVHYQDRAYALCYARRVRAAMQAERRTGAHGLATLVADNLYKLMAYKDEYEVCRLQGSAEHLNQLKRRFGDAARPEFHFHLPLLSARRRRTVTLGAWSIPLLRAMGRLRFLRGSIFDPFSYLKERRLEQRFLAEYQSLLDILMTSVSPENADKAAALASLPERVRGFGAIKIQAMQEARRVRDALLSDFVPAEGD